MKIFYKGHKTRNVRVEEYREFLIFYCVNISGKIAMSENSQFVCQLWIQNRQSFFGKCIMKIFLEFKILMEECQEIDDHFKSTFLRLAVVQVVICLGIGIYSSYLGWYVLLWRKIWHFNFIVKIFQKVWALTKSNSNLSFFVDD